MSEVDTNVSGSRKNNVLIIAVIIVALVIVFMHFWDQHQQRALELHRLEKRVEVLEEWSPPWQRGRQSNLPQRTGGRRF